MNLKMNSCLLRIFFLVTIFYSTALSKQNSSSSSTKLANQVSSGTQGQPLAPAGGPNVCGSSRQRSYCCPGWTMRAGTSLCIIPICTRPCGSKGKCIRPNICMCDGGAVSSACDSSSDSTSCGATCLNGGTCSGKKCSCRTGFNGQYCGDPVCREGCLNGGRCIGPDRCACVYGFTGRRCEADYRTGPCFRRVRNSMCEGQLQGVVCTKILCCATIGKAWGHPCEHCPSKLECDRGFIKNIHSSQCQDIDECEAVPGVCQGGKCVNSIGSFHCECPSGYRMNDEIGSCEDINECKTIPGSCSNGKCFNTEGDFYCTCDSGFIPTQNRKYCIDAQQGNCYTAVVNGQCQNRLAIRLTFTECCCGVNIGKGWGDPTCQLCPVPGTDSYRQSCESVIEHGPGVNECALNPSLCQHGRCVDLKQGYRCECNVGYRLEGENHCVDLDECLDPSYCVGGHCVNLPGSYQCICLDGFQVASDGKTCIDRDECGLTGMCANGMCINIDGSFKCQCNSGFILSPTGLSCIDIDECTENGRICLNGRCDNVPGSYHCVCNPGFQLSPDGSFCLDYDECKVTGMCTNGQCINVDGSFKCLCDAGYLLSPDGQVCLDINECDVTPGICVNGQCINNQGSYRCQCGEGFNLGTDGKTCLDTRKGYCYSQYRSGECINPSSVLFTKSACCCTAIPNVVMGWGIPCTKCPDIGTREFLDLCLYDPGKSHDGRDINECLIHPNICPNGACENLVGSYRCICNPGYFVDSTGKLCSDINECAINLLLCENGQCRNTPGSYQCICPTGFRLNAITNACEDIDECTETGISPCHGGACVNIAGSFRCDCEPGTVLDSSGRVCRDDRRGACWTKIRDGRCEDDIHRLILKSECCGSVGKAWGSPCELCSNTTLRCPVGQAMIDGMHCEDINECDLFPDICKGGGLCVNSEGSFKCNCPPGLILDSSGVRCVDLREEPCYLKYEHGQCTRPIPGQYKRVACCCARAAAWGSPCTRCPKDGSEEYEDLCVRGIGITIDEDIGLFTKGINECVLFPGICTNGRCRNTADGFICHCDQGFVLDETGFNCTDIDECSITKDVCGPGLCRNIPGSFVCDCEVGYDSMPMMPQCMDVNECIEDQSLCLGGTCVNVAGSFRCDCPVGHELTPTGQACKDIDECSRTSSICTNGVCENMMGTYQCICNEGYKQTSIKSSCEDIDECEDRNGNCQDQCVNTPGSYTCACSTGYMLLPDGFRCGDIDECVVDLDACSGGQCENFPGYHTCYCIGGLMPSPDLRGCLVFIDWSSWPLCCSISPVKIISGSYRQHVDECVLNPNLCMQGECENTLGSFQCRCEDGYSVKADTMGCTDDDECQIGTHTCDPDADCFNNLGSFQCRCKDGFRGDGFSCQDINECLRDNGGCDQDAACINIDGSFQCVCDVGFSGDGAHCIDIDECSVNPDLCENGQCLNFPGAYRCECDMGFTQDPTNRICIDIDECEMFHNICVFGRCENIFGMFRCVCDEGFQVDETGGNCTDIDECKNSQLCLQGTCINNLGSYICQCPPNYELTLDRTGCIDRRQGTCYLDVAFKHDSQAYCSNVLGHRLSKASCCCTSGKAWGPTCEICPAPNTSEYKTLCPEGPGFKPNNVTLIFEDIDECVELPGICRGGRCSNTFGSFICICPDGYTLDDTQRTCIDVNECSLHVGICGVGTCINTEGNYTCICPEGYMLLPSGKKCVDMRKSSCFRSYHNDTTVPGRIICESAMSGSQTRMSCCCTIGRAWGSPCEPCPIRGSVEYQHLCPVDGMGVDPFPNRTGPGTTTMFDIDECIEMPSLCQNGFCMNTIGSFKCDCRPGFRYELASYTCIDINECVEQPGQCLGSAECENTVGSFRCVCPAGYKLSPNGRDCLDINECYEHPPVCVNGDCVNFQGGFQCICKHGYYLTASRDQCIDIDECARILGICNNGSCHNTQGSYRCVCHDGFELTPNNDCFDIDECRTLLSVCRNGRCRNTQGSFTCECQFGYRLTDDRRSCTDVDECTEITNICRNGVCRNSEGSFVCTCPDGYELSPSQTECRDINECFADPNLCRNGQCFNTDGGFFCSCPRGYRLVNKGRDCQDTRVGNCYQKYERGYCSLPRPMNQTRAECCCSSGAAWGSDSCEACPDSSQEAFRSLCPDGLGYVKGPEIGMEDINECIMHPAICINGKCINTDGSFRCECSPGYILDSSGLHCIDEDECLKRNICGNGTCNNILGSFECSCFTGFVPGPLHICEDFDECVEHGNLCAFRCQNTPGSFRCICPYGYNLSPDGRHCQDVDECLTPVNDCRFECKNLVGSFLCICPEGYQQVGLDDNCVDVNECVTLRDACKNGRCVNLQGSYRCDCYDGYQQSKDRKQCIDIRSGICYHHVINGVCTPHTTDLVQVTKADCCCGRGMGWGPRCEICPVSGSADYRDLCPHGPGFSKDGRDVDECATMRNLCRNGRCVNTFGSYRCVCNRGYEADPSHTQCFDINECDRSPVPCKFHCHNTDGSYTCSCITGYSLSPDGLTCKDVDECTTKQHNCTHTCVNTEGGFQCTCPPGYSQQGQRCIDIDECIQSPQICGRVGNCVNTKGSYKCICPRGYRTDPTGTKCEDLDECGDDTRCDHGCQNLPGTFRCDCPDGFIKHSGWNACIDEDECADGETCGSAACENTVGSFKCGCPLGYQFDGLLLLCLDAGGACSGSPCSFGCLPGGPLGYTCGCPSGYHRIGQGHCLSTISPTGSAYDNSIDALSIHPINDLGSYGVPDDKIISTEGCYSCKLNGYGARHRRSLNFMENLTEITKIKPIAHTKHRLKPEDHLKKSSNNVTSKVSNLSSPLNDTIGLRISLTYAARNHRRIVKLQPALDYLQNNVVYSIVEGNDDRLFELKTRHGITSLHFTQRMKQSGNFHIDIVGKSIQTSELFGLDRKVESRNSNEIFHIKFVVNVIA